MRRLLAALLLLLLVGGARAAHADTTLRIGTIAPEGTRYMKDMRLLSQEIERLSGDELHIKWYNAGRLGDEKTMAGLMNGEGDKLDGGAFTGIGISYLAVEVGIWLFPGMFQSYDEVDYIESKYRDSYEKTLAAKGYILVAWTDVGFTNICSSSSISSYEELKEHTLWVWSDDQWGIEAAKHLGIKIVTTSLNELIEGLRKGTIDTFIFPPLAIVGWGIHGYVKYISELTWNYLPGAIVLRKDVFDALPADQQKVILAVGKKWEPRFVKSWRAENDKALLAMQKQGTKLVHVTNESRESFFHAASEQRSTFSKTYNTEDLMTHIADDLQQYRGTKR